jgi:hypothetical protein
MSEANVIAKVEKPVSRRQWDFYLPHGNRELAIIVVVPTAESAWPRRRTAIIQASC